MKATTKGFQSIKEETTIEVQGLTVITGKSNIGKSALIRSILAALHNRRGSGFISKGSDEAVTTIERNDHRVTWVKGKSTQYTIDGTVHKKAGRSTPPEVGLLGFHGIEAHEKIYYPQIARQMDKPFLISESNPVVAAQLISSSKSTAILAKAVKLASQQQNKENTEVKIREERLEELQQQISRGRPHRDPLKQRKTEVQNAHLAYETLKSRRDLLRDLKERFRTIEARRDAAALMPVDELSPVPSADKCITIRQLHQQHRRVQSISGIVLTDRDVKLVLQSKLDKTEKLSKISVQRRALLQITNYQLPKAPPTTPRLGNWMDLQDAQQRRRVIIEQKQDAQQQIDETKEEVKRIEQEVKEIVSLLGHCPVCGRSDSHTHDREVLKT